MLHFFPFFTRQTIFGPPSSNSQVREEDGFGCRHVICGSIEAAVTRRGFTTAIATWQQMQAGLPSRSPPPASASSPCMPCQPAASPTTTQFEPKKLHTCGDDNNGGDDGVESSGGRGGWKGRPAGRLWTERLPATLAGGRPWPSPCPTPSGPAWMVVDGGVYLSMLATGKRAGLSGAVELLILHGLTRFFSNDAFGSLGKADSRCSEKMLSKCQL